MKAMLMTALKWVGVQGQLKKDLALLFVLAMTYAQEQEDKLGAGKGEAKRKAAIEELFNEVEKEGGIEPPSWMTGSPGRKLFGFFLDLVVGLANGEQPKN